MLQLRKSKHPRYGERHTVIIWERTVYSSSSEKAAIRDSKDDNVCLQAIQRANESSKTPIVEAIFQLIEPYKKGKNFIVMYQIYLLEKVD